MSCLELAENTYFVFLALKLSRLLKFLQCVGKMRYGGVDDGKGMFNDSEGVQNLGGREMFAWCWWC